eukprot:623257-Lingulodinium_polyedra.AAC.1
MTSLAQDIESWTEWWSLYRKPGSLVLDERLVDQVRDAGTAYETVTQPLRQLIDGSTIGSRLFSNFLNAERN